MPKRQQLETQVRQDVNEVQVEQGAVQGAQVQLRRRGQNPKGQLVRHILEVALMKRQQEGLQVQTQSASCVYKFGMRQRVHNVLEHWTQREWQRYTTANTSCRARGVALLKTKELVYCTQLKFAALEPKQQETPLQKEETVADEVAPANEVELVFTRDRVQPAGTPFEKTLQDRLNMQPCRLVRLKEIVVPVANRGLQSVAPCRRGVQGKVQYTWQAPGDRKFSGRHI